MEKPLNVTSDNGIIRLLCYCGKIDLDSNSQITEYKVSCVSKRFLTVFNKLIFIPVCPNVITLSGFHCMHLLLI